MKTIRHSNHHTTGTLKLLTDEPNKTNIQIETHSSSHSFFSVITRCPHYPQCNLGADGSVVRFAHVTLLAANVASGGIKSSTLHIISGGFFMFKIVVFNPEELGRKKRHLSLLIRFDASAFTDSVQPLSHLPRSSRDL